MRTLRARYWAERPAQRMVFDSQLPSLTGVGATVSRVLRTVLRNQPTSENPRVEAIFELAVPLLHVGLQNVLPHLWRVGVTASFVHGGGPGRYVADYGPARCEIGDLLLVVEYRLPNASTRSALLLQAKKPLSQQQVPWLRDSGPKQFGFYSTQASFSWASNGIGTARRTDPRTLKPADLWCPCPSDWYRWGDRHWSRWLTSDAIHGGLLFTSLAADPWCVPAIEPMRTPQPLADAITHMFLFCGGAPFVGRKDAYAAPTLEWSAVVWDLLTASRTKHYRQMVSDRSAPYLLEDEEGATVNTEDDDESRAHRPESSIVVVRIIVDAREDEMLRAERRPESE